MGNWLLHPWRSLVAALDAYTDWSLGAPRQRDPPLTPKPMITSHAVLFSVAVGFGFIAIGVTVIVATTAIFAPPLRWPSGRLLVGFTADALCITFGTMIFLTLNGWRREASRYWPAGEQYYRGLFWAFGITALFDVLAIELEQSRWDGLFKFVLWGGLLMLFLLWYRWLQRVSPRLPDRKFGDARSVGDTTLKDMGLSDER